MKKGFFVLLAGTLMWLASATSVFACSWWMHQPEAPKSLLK